jgi:hypothetical protein
VLALEIHSLLNDIFDQFLMACIITLWRGLQLDVAFILLKESCTKLFGEELYRMSCLEHLRFKGTVEVDLKLCHV